MSRASLYVFVLALLGLLTASDASFQVISERAEIYPLPELGFSYDALEPYIDEATLQAHHAGHHQTYTKKMNAALQSWRNEERQHSTSTDPIVDILRDLDKIPEAFRKAIVNNGGGYVNHALYWATMSPNGGGSPSGYLLSDIEKNFGSFDKFKEVFSSTAASLFGSGYVWLSRSGDDLVLSTTANQDSPISNGLNPILVLDVWEHAYYLKHQYRRADYIESWWNIVGWDQVEALDAWWKGDKSHSYHSEL